MGIPITCVRIGIIDDHRIVVEGLVRILGKMPGARVVFEGATADAAVRLAVEHEPDLLIIDLGIEGGGLNAIKKIRDQVPNVRCVIFTASDDPNLAIAAMSLGAKGYILKGIGSNELVAALNSIRTNQSYVSPEFAMKLVAAANHRGQAQHSDVSLNVRETQVIAQVEKGLTNRQIAENLKISEQTVKYYMSSLMQKYGATNRTHAAVEFRKRQQGEAGHGAAGQSRAY